MNHGEKMDFIEENSDGSVYLVKQIRVIKIHTNASE